MMSKPEIPCPKCGGKMVNGELQIPTVHGNQLAYPFSIGGYMGGMPSMIYETSEKPIWVESTGEKKGMFIKREETKQLAILGFRCKVCGYIELYTKEV